MIITRYGDITGFDDAEIIILQEDTPMNIKYFKDQICDELDGACDYLKKSIDCSKLHPDWSKSFHSMAEMEEGHATTLYKMFMEMYAESEGKDSYVTQMRDAIMECFSTRMRKIEDLKATYNIMEHKSKTQETKYPEDMYIPE